MQYNMVSIAKILLHRSMRKAIIVAACMAMAMPVAAQRLRLMTYNIRHGAGMDTKVDFGRTAAVIRSAKADVVALQEVDSVTGRCNGKYVGGELAALTGLTATFSKAIDFDGGAYGVAILSKEKPVAIYRHALPGREEGRTLLIAEFERYAVCCSHLSLTEEDRLASVETIAKALKAIEGKPVYLMGDFNDHPDSPFMREMEKHFTVISDTTATTFPADAPNETLDYVMTLRNGVKTKAKGCRVINEPAASDHRPVVVNVKW